MPTKTFGENTTDDYTGVTKDTYIRDGGYKGVNYENDALAVYVHYYGSGSSSTRKGLLKFDLSGLSGVTLLTATLRLYVINDSTLSNLEISSCSRAWVAASATWNNYDGVNAWGANHDKDTVLVNVVTSGVDGAYHSHSSAALLAYLQDVIDGADGAPANTANFLFRDAGSAVWGNYYQFNDEGDADGQRPYLEVTYGASAGAVAGPPQQTLKRRFGHNLTR